MTSGIVRLLVAVIFIVSYSIANAAGLPKPFSIIPEPHSVTLANGKGFQLQKIRSIQLNEKIQLPVLGQELAALPVLDSKARNSIHLRIDSGYSAIPKAEGYQLTVTTDKIEIIARDAAGLFYGCQTLEQLLEDARRFKVDLPACTILDYPSLSYRSVHFDVKHHLDHMNYYYESVDRLARYKINAIVFEFEDKLRYQRQPLVGAPNAISIEEMAALTQYARKRNIEITPLVQGLGHASFILKHEAYRGLRELPWNDWAFCPLHEGTYQVLFDLYRDAIAATPGSRYLHIGGDEIGNIGICSRCEPFVKKNGMGNLNLYWLKRVCEFAQENNRVPIFWDDMPLQEAGLYESTWNEAIDARQADSLWQKGRPILDSLQPGFPKNCMYMRWNYSMATQPGNLLCLDWYQQHGLQAMIATATNAEGGMLFQPEIRNKGNVSAGNSCIKSFIEIAARKNIGGMLCTAWDDKSPHMENYWPGFIAAAEYSWSPEGKSLEALDEAWANKEFGITIPGYDKLRNRLRSGSTLWYEALLEKGSLLDDENMLQSLKQIEHWLKPLEGRENMVFDYSTKIIDLPNSNNPGSWTEKYQAKLRQAAIVVSDFPELLAQLQQLENLSIRNKYYWRVAAALCRFQTATPKVLLALQDLDKPGITNQQRKDRINLAVTELQESFRHLSETYGETRFTVNSPGFVKDRYFHLASQREDLSWMNQAQELLEQKINRWLNQPN